GLHDNIIGPLIPTLIEQTHSTLQEISSIISLKSVGILIGSIIGGIIGNYLHGHRPLILFSTLCLSGLTFLCLVYTSKMGFLIAIMLILGFLHANVVMNSHILLGSLWDKLSTTAFNFVHAGTSLGGVIATLLVRPFILLDSEAGKNVNNSTKREIGPVIDSLPPDSILTCLSLFVAFFFLPLWMYNIRNRTAAKSSENVDPRSVSATEEGTIWQQMKDFYSSTNAVKAMVTLVPITLLVICSLERIFANFIVTFFSRLELKLDDGEILLVNTIYWISFSLGRILFSLIGAFLLDDIILMFTSIISVILIFFFLLIKSKVSGIVIIGFYGCIIGGLMPSVLAKINSTLRINGALAMLIEIGNSIGVLVVINLIGFVLSKYDTICFIYVCGVLHIIIVVLSICLIYFASKIEKNPRFDDEILIAKDDDILCYHTIDSLTHETSKDSSEMN
ncbi:hypothetical protein Ciccas_005412, partial [Cichlidogyrus casuarinus]